MNIRSEGTPLATLASVSSLRDGRSRLIGKSPLRMAIGSQAERTRISSAKSVLVTFANLRYSRGSAAVGPKRLTTLPIVSGVKWT